VIYLFCGSDVERVRSKAFAWIAAARAKQPDLTYARFAKEELTKAVLEDVAFSGGLFIKRLLVLIDDPFAKTLGGGDEEAETKGSLLTEEGLAMLAKSDNAIVILAPRLAVAQAKKVAAQAAKTYQFDKGETKDQRGFNTNLVNALAAKSREKLWLETVRALAAGDAPEMLHGLLHWKARDILEKGSRTWKPLEARVLSLSLIKLLQESRRTGGDLARALERFALSL